MHCVAVWCIVSQCVAVGRSVLQCIAACCSVWQYCEAEGNTSSSDFCVSIAGSIYPELETQKNGHIQYVCTVCLYCEISSKLYVCAVCCSVLQCVAVCCSVCAACLYCEISNMCVDRYCKVRHMHIRHVCVTVCCSVLQCVAVCVQCV